MTLQQTAPLPGVPVSCDTTATPLAENCNGIRSDRDPDPGEGQRLRICLASMAPFLGGAEIAAERLAIGLRELGHDVLVVLGRRGPVSERIEKAQLRWESVPMALTDKWNPLPYIRSRRRLHALLRRERPDVVHSNDLPTHQVLSGPAGALGIPRVCHHRYPFPGSAIDWMNKYSTERGLFVSKYLMKTMCRESLSLNRSPQVVVHDGLPLPARVTPADRAIRRSALGLDPDRIIVTFAGQMIERKGVGVLLQAWMMMSPEARERADLLLIGDDLQGRGAYRKTMEGLAASLGCPARFLGFRDDLPDWLIASDIAVVPSLIEPLGNATLEAMSQGLPVLGSDVGGIPEMIEHRKTGLLVEPGRPEAWAVAMAWLILDESTRRAMGEAGRQRCEEHFALKVHAQKVLTQYRLALSAHSSDHEAARA